MKLTVVLQWVLIVALFGAHSYDTRRMPDQLRDYVIEMAAVPLTPSGVAAIILAFLIVAFGLIGGIGVLRLKPWGRRLYAIAILLTPFLAPGMGMRIWGPFESMIYDILVPMEGFTLALLYFSQASEEFEK